MQTYNQHLASCCNSVTQTQPKSCDKQGHSDPGTIAPRATDRPRLGASGRLRVSHFRLPSSSLPSRSPPLIALLSSLSSRPPISFPASHSKPESGQSRTPFPRAWTRRLPHLCSAVTQHTQTVRLESDPRNRVSPVANMASSADEIREVEEELDLQQAILQSLDTTDCLRPDAIEQRSETLEEIRGLQRRRARLRGDHTTISTSDSFPARQSITNPGPPPAQLDGSFFSAPAPPVPPAPIPPISPQQSSPTFSLPSRPRYSPSHISSNMDQTRKRPFAGEREDDFGSRPTKRAAVRTSAPSEQTGASTRAKSEETVDDLLDILGLGGQDMEALQEEQRSAERWLEKRKEQERQDAEFARSLSGYHNTALSPGPSSPGPSRVNPDPSRPEPSFPGRFLPPPASQSQSSFPTLFNSRGMPSRPAPAIETNNAFRGPQFESARTNYDSDDSDVAEIDPREFRLNGGPSMYPGSIPTESPYMFSGPKMVTRWSNKGHDPGDPTAFSSTMAQRLPALKKNENPILGLSESLMSQGPIGSVLNSFMDHELQNNLSSRGLP